MLRDLKARGMRAPKLAIGDGALGFWAALGEFFPEAREQSCWVHTIANAPDKLPKSLQSKAKSMLHEAMNAPSRRACEKAMEALMETYGAKYPKVAQCLKEDTDKLMTQFRLSGRVLEAPANDEPDRVDLRDREASNARHQGRGLARRGARDRLQATC